MSELVPSEPLEPSAYPEYREQMDRMPEEPNLGDHVRLLNVLANEAGERVKHRDGRQFRQAMFDHLEELCEMISTLANSYEVGDTRTFRDVGGQVSGKIAEMSVLAEDGIKDLDETNRFFRMAGEVCRRVESLEDLKTRRMSVLSERTVMKLVDLIPVVLSKYLTPDRAQDAYSDIFEGFKLSGADDE